MTKHFLADKNYRLTDCYDRRDGRVFMTGTQALVRIMLDQARRDRDNAMTTAGFISGYRGSPLGGLDKALWSIEARLQAENITFMPAINEDLGATAILGTQQVSLDPHATVEGVFSMWYGKGPGVDRSGDALKHGNAYGSSPKGGVLVVAGDDHGCVSSSMPHQSDVAFMAWFMPILNPASIAEYSAFGEYGIALSRFSGTWVGFKAISETVESGQSVELQPDRVFVQPEFSAPPGGLHIRLSDLPSPEIETRIAAKLDAVRCFVDANPIDKVIYHSKDARIGIVTTGKSHLDTLEALRLLGLDASKCRALGIDIYKVGMVWPLARRDALAFTKGKQELLIIEEKRGILESQFKEYFYDYPGSKPTRMVGKHDENMAPLVPWTGELSPLLLVPILAQRLDGIFPDLGLGGRADRILATPPPVLQVSGATRTPYFCSGCPHNTSTKLPEGSQAASGIGCHVMASWMDRETVGYAQMGGEGVPWVATSQFNGGRHLFQNIGEGTWYHSGSLAIRQAVAANTNITFKILYNDAVAMTGGQPVDGPISPAAIAWSSRAEGITRIAVVSDDIAKFRHADFPPGTSFDDRNVMDQIQRELRDIKGVTVLIYEQTCATEKRRRRKTGQIKDLQRFVVINDLVCEGCGDCSLESNCLSVEPKMTPFGTKRQINLSSCNKDFSCLNGFCPSFVTIQGGRRRKKEFASLDLPLLASALPLPRLPDLSAPYDLLVTGVGGTGVITVGAVITVAAHLEGHGASVLDFTGFAQKFGTVLSYVRLALAPEQINQVRTGNGAADAVIGCDVVVSSSPKASVHYHKGTRMVLNLAEMPTGDMVLNRDADISVKERVRVIKNVIGSKQLFQLDANQQAEALFGDTVFANVMLMGAAWQRGLIPVGLEALHQALHLNGVLPEKNIAAFSAGRLLAETPDVLAAHLPASTLAQDTYSQLRHRHMQFLTDYQDATYASQYLTRLDILADSMPDWDEAHAIAAAKSLFKLMATKDEYEVARLHVSPEFRRYIEQNFEGNYTLSYHLAPPLLPLGKDAKGRPRKRRFGAWSRVLFSALSRVRKIRGTWCDPFRFGRDRVLDRNLLEWFGQLLDQLPKVSASMTQEEVLALLTAPMDIRGYGIVRETAALSVVSRYSEMPESARLLRLLRNAD